MTEKDAIYAEAAAAAVEYARAHERFWSAVRAIEAHNRRADATHDGNHAPLPEGVRLSPGFCAGCDKNGGESDD